MNTKKKMGMLQRRKMVGWFFLIPGVDYFF